MNKQTISDKLDEIEQASIEVESIIKVTRNSCEHNDYLEEFQILSIACKKQSILLEKINELSIIDTTFDSI